MKLIHEKVLEILEEKRKQDKSLLFTLRRSNRFERLDKSYWFHGNENYLALSFWSGMDWRNKTPNINFIIRNDGSSYLEVSVSDSDKKMEFIKNYFIPAFEKEGISLNLHYWPSKIYIEFVSSDFTLELYKFLDHDGGIKTIIDKVIRKHTKFFSSKEEEIGFIDEKTFLDNLKRVKKYQQKNDRLTIVAQSQIFLTKLEIANVGDIRNKVTLKIPKNTQWVFITGENGSGKSTILKALTSDIIKEAKSKYYPDSSAKINTTFERKIAKHDKIKHKYKCHGFAAYGASRLINSDSEEIDEVKSSDYYSLFEPNGILISIDDFLNEINKGSDGADHAADMIRIIEEAFNDDDELFPQIAKAELKSLHNLKESLFYEKDNDGEIYDKPVTFNKLASGTKNQIALISDMIARLYKQLKSVGEPSELYGIVVIDEIDVHFHPLMQKKIVEILSANFPYVQFIVTTHSPVTLLGAPEKSAFFTVKRTKEFGVQIEELTDFDPKTLTPNLLLTSPVFGFSNLFNRNLLESYELLQTEDTWGEMKTVNQNLSTLIKKYEERKSKLNND